MAADPVAAAQLGGSAAGSETAGQRVKAVELSRVRSFQRETSRVDFFVPNVSSERLKIPRLHPAQIRFFQSQQCFRETCFRERCFRALLCRAPPGKNFLTGSGARFMLDFFRIMSFD